MPKITKYYMILVPSLRKKGGKYIYDKKVKPKNVQFVAKPEIGQSQGSNCMNF